MTRIINIEKEFIDGKRYLDNDDYLQCIQTYDELIPILQKTVEDPDFKGILEASYNNRGGSKMQTCIDKKKC